MTPVQPISGSLLLCVGTWHRVWGVGTEDQDEAEQDPRQVRRCDADNDGRQSKDVTQ